MTESKQYKACIVTPAYGRDYTSRSAAETDFHQNLDFILVDMFSQWDGKPCNKADLIKAGYTTVEVRYRKKQRLSIIHLD